MKDLYAELAVQPMARRVQLGEMLEQLTDRELLEIQANINAILMQRLEDRTKTK